MSPLQSNSRSKSPVFTHSLEMRFVSAVELLFNAGTEDDWEALSVEPMSQPDEVPDALKPV